MTRKDILTALRARGIDAEPTETEKNNTILEGITITSGSVRPVVYTAEIIETAEKEGLDLETVADMIAEKLQSVPAFDTDNLYNPDFIRDHIKIGLQQKTNEDIVKRLYNQDESIEAYLYMDLDVTNLAATVKIKPGMLKSINLSVAEAWKLARINTFKDLEMIKFDDLMGPLPAGCSMYILTNKDRYRGAASLLDMAFIRKFAKDHNVNDVVVLPSSIHEVLLMPGPAENLEALTDMVRAVNNTIAPTDILADHAIQITLGGTKTC